jgi:hypothetical protein
VIVTTSFGQAIAVVVIDEEESIGVIGMFLPFGDEALRVTSPTVITAESVSLCNNFVHREVTSFHTVTDDFCYGSHTFSAFTTGFGNDDSSCKFSFIYRLSSIGRRS